MTVTTVKGKGRICADTDIDIGCKIGKFLTQEFIPYVPNWFTLIVGCWLIVKR